MVSVHSWGKQHTMSEQPQENNVVEEPTETTVESSVKRKKVVVKNGKPSRHASSVVNKPSIV